MLERWRDGRAAPRHAEAAVHDHHRAHHHRGDRRRAPVERPGLPAARHRFLLRRKEADRHRVRRAGPVVRPPCRSDRGRRRRAGRGGPRLGARAAAGAGPPHRRHLSRAPPGGAAPARVHGVPRGARARHGRSPPESRGDHRGGAVGRAAGAHAEGGAGALPGDRSGRLGRPHADAPGLARCRHGARTRSRRGAPGGTSRDYRRVRGTRVGLRHLPGAVHGPRGAGIGHARRIRRTTTPADLETLRRHETGWAGDAREIPAAKKGV